ncbi:hypothetical protein GCM10011613_20690 [Cellvibrio zantedeschiae]|uniref:Serine aminopeptidase S33 domain-containing protein n=1 Tax=Cellvibrio zantedeschiae TaxID=1237077 RepID=A0ABQ3B1V6_9GAMM|nr:alpha/beta hydrolase [Cellvibrio zantedeschiae]GGY75063.1 hypothetical protein GCM10011613_20690 [Cellvibrio zantedeschiae]
MKVFLTAVLLFIPIAPTHAGTFITEEIQFTSHNTQLFGSIVRPKEKEIRAAVVFVHGSGKQSRNLKWAEKFAAEGIATLVYDKRGAGKSGGNYESNQSVSEKNINLLADDAVAAVEALSKQSALKNVPLGLTGISQAGWIVPIAAEKSSAVKFMVLWSGPVCKVSEEDIFSQYNADKDSNNVPTYDDALSARKVKYVWPDFLGKDSDPADNLRKLNIPGLWIFGGNDGSVPVDLSIKRLDSIKQSGHEYNYVLFSGLGHNNMEETFTIASDWILRLVK